MLEAKSRSHDVVARYGGEEFAVILPETDLDGAERYAEKMRCAVEALRLEGDRSCLTVSIGVAACDSDVVSSKDLVAAADARLYRAKQGGRNRVCAEGA